MVDNVHMDLVAVTNYTLKVSSVYSTSTAWKLLESKKFFPQRLVKDKIFKVGKMCNVSKMVLVSLSR